jgi:CheY-like chemotaxis protein
MLLRIEGVDVAGTGSGHEALTVFRSRHFDVVVSDLGLPDISGWESVVAYLNRLSLAPAA